MGRVFQGHSLGSRKAHAHRPRITTTIRPNSAQKRFMVVPKTREALEATRYSKQEQESIDRPVIVTAILVRYSATREI